MTTWIDDIAQYLEDSTTAIGIFSPTSTQSRSIYCYNLPGSTASLSMLYPYAGLASEDQMDGDSIRKPRLKVIVHSMAADGGQQKGIDIRTRLHRVNALKLPSTAPARHYVMIEALDEPEYLGKDEIGRGQTGVNFQIQYINTT